MARLLSLSKGENSEGFVFNKFIKSRMIRHNKNVLLAITGPTGSGKSYTSLRVAELWYKDYFHKPFPIKNCCFTVDSLIRLLHSKELKRGEIIILEEAGVNLNSLDFQNKIAKLFTFVLQSFRSMNLCLILNLPVLTMLNKSARLLLHSNFVTAGIDFTKKTSIVKPYFHQLNQQTGKVYSKYLRVKHGGIAKPVKKFVYKIPSEELIKEYEKEKLKFVSDLLGGFVAKLQEEQSLESIKMARETLTDVQQEAYEDWVEGLTQKQSAEKRGKNIRCIWEARKICKRKGFEVKKSKIPREIEEIHPIPIPIAPMT